MRSLVRYHKLTEVFTQCAWSHRQILKNTGSSSKDFHEVCNLKFHSKPFNYRRTVHFGHINGGTDARKKVNILKPLFEKVNNMWDKKYSNFVTRYET
jgi:hypothetical protein